MTRDYPLAGRELDRIVAERVMGGCVEVGQPGGRNARVLARIRFRDGTVADGAATEWCVDMDPSNHVWMHVPHYSTDIAAALLVWREVYQRWRRHLCMYAMPTPNGDRIVVDIMHGLHGQASATADAHSEAYAICLAALRALDAEGGEDER